MLIYLKVIFIARGQGHSVFVEALHDSSPFAPSISHFLNFKLPVE